MVDLYNPNLLINEPTATPSAGGGAGFGGMSAFLMAAQAIGGAVSTYEQSQAQKAIARVRMRIAQMRGQQAEAQVRQRGNKVVGAQRAALAAQGIRLDYGSAQDVQEETKTISELDALTIKNNALREGFGYSVESSYGSAVATAQSVDTLLAGGINAYNAYKYGGG